MSRPDALVSPSFFLEERDIADLVAEFGPYAGRYVYEYPPSWKQDFLSAVGNLPPVERKRATEWLLKRMKQTLLATPLAYDRAKTWAGNVKSCKLSTSGSIRVGDAGNPEGLDTWPEALPKIRESSRRTFFMPATCGNYLHELSPLLSVSPACYLIDQYFNPLRPDALALIQSLLDRIKSGPCRNVTIITRHPRTYLERVSERDKGAINSFENNLRETYRGLLRGGQELIILIVDNGKRDSPYLHMHPRYFMTKYGGLKFDDGFHFNVDRTVNTQHTDNIDVGIIDQGAFEKIKDQYINGVVRHEEKIKLLSSSKPAKRVERITITR